MSTFTGSLNLELVARGDDVGTWDVPENSNWGLVDSAMGGVATVALTNSNVTLSQSQYKCNFLIFTGAISANIAITLPNVGRLYTIQNLTSNTSAFYITMTTTAAGGQAIGIPPGEVVEIMTDGTNTKFRNFGRVGTYWDYMGSSNPAWNTACTVPPYLQCNAGTFSSATYPVLATIWGTTTLPDSQGRARFSLDGGTNRITTAGSSIDGAARGAAGGNQEVTLDRVNLPSTTVTVTATDLGHSHVVSYNTVPLGAGSAANALTNINPGQPFTNANTNTGTANITASFNLNGNVTQTTVNKMPPAYIGGLTFVRAG